MKTILILVGVAGVAGAGYLAWCVYQKKKQAPAAAPKTAQMPVVSGPIKPGATLATQGPIKA